MSQTHTFYVDSSERAFGLRVYLAENCSKITNLDFAIRGGYTKLSEGRDFFRMAFVRENHDLGTFRYRLTEGVYNCIIDLSGFPTAEYQLFIRKARSEFPEIDSSNDTPKESSKKPSPVPQR